MLSVLLYRKGPLENGKNAETGRVCFSEVQSTEAAELKRDGFEGSSAPERGLETPDQQELERGGKIRGDELWWDSKEALSFQCNPVQVNSDCKCEPMEGCMETTEVHRQGSGRDTWVTHWLGARLSIFPTASPESNSSLLLPANGAAPLAPKLSLLLSIPTEDRDRL